MNLYYFFRHDRKLVARYKPSGIPNSNSFVPNVSKLPNQQFGASLEFIRLNNNDKLIPPIMTVCIDFLSDPENLDTEGIFRKAGNVAMVKEMKAKINNGEEIVFTGGDVHIGTWPLSRFYK